MTRRRRMAVELLGPPLVATGVIVLVAFAREPSGLLDAMKDWRYLGGVLVILAFAYVVAAIPCILFTVVMEVAFAKGLDPASWGTVPLAAVLGLLSGMGVVGFDPSYGAFEGMAMTGLATGTILGFVVRAGSRPAVGNPASLERPNPVSH